MSAPDEGGAPFRPELQYVAMGEALMWSIESKFGRVVYPGTREAGNWVGPVPYGLQEVFRRFVS